MGPKATLIEFRHRGDLLHAIASSGPWSVPVDGPEGLPNALLSHLVDRRVDHPVLFSDDAFATLPVLVADVAGARGCSAADVNAALRRLEAERLVERCGAADGGSRWRASQHAVHSLRAALIAA